MDIVQKSLELENGLIVTFTAGPRYPFWKISYSKGAVPASLSGVYQSYDEAVYAVKTHVEVTRSSRNRTKIKE